MIQELKWGVESPAGVSVEAVASLVDGLNNKTQNWCAVLGRVLPLRDVSFPAILSSTMHANCCDS